MGPAYIIHLKRSTDRLKIIQDLKVHFPQAEVVDAVDGRLLSESQKLNLFRKPPLQPKFPFQLMDGEYGCFLSHIGVWKKVADGPAPFAIVMEDDVVVSDGFSDVLQLTAKNADENCLIRFPIKQREVPKKIIAEQGKISLFEPKVIGLTTAMYIIGRSAARKLLQGCQTFDRPVDVWLQMRWETGVRSTTVWPSFISSGASKIGGSTIQNKAKGFSKIAREFNRTRYRAAVRRYSGKS